MIGVSLPFSWFLEAEQNSQLKDRLEALRRWGVKSVELRTVRPHHGQADVLRAMEILWSNDFLVTVHASALSVETAREDVFGPLKTALSGLRQAQLTVTVHPIVGDNGALIRTLSDCILENRYPVTLVLENNRLMPDKSAGDSLEMVLGTVKALGRDNVKICFDMGHYAYYCKRFFPEQYPDMLPDRELWKHVGHTHIHGMNGLKTHFPLGLSELPLQQYLNCLSCGYFGVYNIELDFPRFADQWEPMEALKDSVTYLRQALPPSALLYDRIREEFDSGLRRAATVWDAEEGTWFSLIHSTSYLFSTNGYPWAMDLAFRFAYALAKTPHQLEKELRRLKLMVLTHGHRDHFEKETVAQLSKMDTVLLVPDFLVEQVLAAGVREDRIVIAKPGEAQSVGPLTFLPFHSCHFRPGGSGVREYGYYVTAPGAPSMVFPGDIRDYDRSNSGFIPEADYCFAHLWLGDDNRDREDCRMRMEPFVRYMLGFSTRHILLTHLYENARPDEKMWRMEHTEPVLEAIRTLSPKTKITVPDWGYKMKL